MFHTHKKEIMDISKIKPHTEAIASKVHDAWWAEKVKQGFHAPNECNEFRFGKGKFETTCSKCHGDMYPYEGLPEHIKEYDRVTVKSVLTAIEDL